MLNAQIRRRSSTRRIVAVAVLCLLVMRAMTFIGMAAAMATPDADNPAFVHVVLGDDCRREDGSESPRKSIHPEHCVLCSFAARDAMASGALFFAEDFLLLPVEPAATAPPFEENLHWAKTPGLIDNWSATSPPRSRDA
jgi:hypothetical protein